MEMGRRDLRRGGGGTNQLSKKKSGSVFSAKVKKGMLKKLSLVDEQLNHKKQNISFEFSSSDLENDGSIKKSKFLKQNLKDTYGVDHPSVPRKLRSAMKKRNLESVSKPSSVSKRLNRSKTEIESLKKGLIKKEAKASVVHESMMISKDEKEVAETLFGLAEMFTKTNSIDNKTYDQHLSSEKETSKVESSLVLDQAVSVSKTNQIDENPLLEQSNKQQSLMESGSENVTDESARAIETKVATSEMDPKGNGLVLWPSLSSTKLPPWMDQAVSPSTSASLLTKPLSVQPRKLNKCASHVYISRLIKVLQSSKSSPQTEQRSIDMSEQELSDPVTTFSDFKSMVSSPPKRYQNPHNPKTLQEDTTQVALDLYGSHTSHKQSYDFLSLSSSGTEAAQSHFNLPNSFTQHHINAAYNNQISPVTYSHQMHQLSFYQANRFQTAYNANQQLQKRLRAAQYRPSNQYSRPNLSLNMTNIQPLHVASSPSYINNVSQQQQHRLMFIN